MAKSFSSTQLWEQKFRGEKKTFFIYAFDTFRLRVFKSFIFLLTLKPTSEMGKDSH